MATLLRAGLTAKRVPGEQERMKVVSKCCHAGPSNCFLDLSPFRRLCSRPERSATHPGHGAISAQDLAKLAAPAAAGSDAADQVCARFASGSATTAPPELESQNGVLEVTFKFLTVTDSQGLVRYCYVTDTGLQAPTLRVNPGDQLIIHFQNDLPAASRTTWPA